MTDTHIKINAVTPRVQYTGNGSTTVFPYEFPIFDETDMVVYVDKDIIESGYTVSGAGETEGGNVTFDVAPEDGVVITLLRNVPIERITDFQEGGTFRPKNINDELDRQTAFAQQIQEALDRCVKVDPTSETNPEEILPKVEELYDHIDNIDAVAGDLTNIDAVAGNQSNIDAVAGNNTDISTVAGISSDVSTVASGASDVSTVATNISDVGTCATNISAIQDAPTQAANAAASAQQAAQSAAAASPPPLFYHNWFDYELNDMAWLRADTFSWQDGTVYTNAYNHLVDDATNGTSQTETIAGHTITYTLAADGHKIVQAANISEVEGLYSDTGVAWYYILDLVNHKFKLPRENPSKEELTKLIQAPVTGNGLTVAWTNGSATGGTFADGGSGSRYGLMAKETGVGQPVAESSSSGTYIAGRLGVTTDASTSGLIARLDLSTKDSSSKGNNYLYFYVGQYSQTATEQTAGLNAELFNGKADIDLENVPSNIGNTAKIFFGGLGMPSHTYDDLTLLASGNTYTAPADGYFYVKKFAGGTGKYISIMNTTTSLAIEAQPTASGNAGNIYLPVKKDDVVQITYNVTGNTDHFMFIYAVGSESEAS